MIEFLKKENAHLYDFCSPILRKRDKGILPIFCMRSIQTLYICVFANLNIKQNKLFKWNKTCISTSCAWAEESLQQISKLKHLKFQFPDYISARSYTMSVRWSVPRSIWYFSLHRLGVNTEQVPPLAYHYRENRDWSTNSVVFSAS